MLAGTAAHTRLLALSGLVLLSGLFLTVLPGTSLGRASDPEHWLTAARTESQCYRVCRDTS